MKRPTLLLAAALAGCVYVPRTTQFYDAECKIEAKRYFLESKQLGEFGRCVNEGCIALLVAAGVITAASVVVSGSIVVVGNAVYWFEKQGKCNG